MKRIGIVTMLGGGNYGNRLQNYAVQCIYESLGFKALTIGRYSKKRHDPRRFFSLKFINSCLGTIGIILNFFHIYNLKWNAYPRFNRNIKFAFYSIKRGNGKKIEKRYDYFSVGSDQVWNPQFALYEEDLLRFSPKKKNIAISASIGVDNLDEVDHEYLKQSFLNFSYISVREWRAKEIVEEISGRNDIEVFIDPTMMLSKEMWKKVERRVRLKQCNRKYILIAFLSEIDSVWREQIYEYAKLNNYDLVELSEKNKKLYNKVGPAEWIYLIHHASFVCTDSFHACAFSLNYNVPFMVFQRRFKKNMYSRIESLKKMFALSNIEYNGKIMIPKIDFEAVNTCLSRERDRTFDILKQWLRG